MLVKVASYCGVVFMLRCPRDLMRLRETLYAVGSEKFNNWDSATLTERILNVWNAIAEHDHVVINFNLLLADNALI